MKLYNRLNGLTLWCALSLLARIASGESISMEDLITIQPNSSLTLQERHFSDGSATNERVNLEPRRKAHRVTDDRINSPRFFENHADWSYSIGVLRQQIGLRCTAFLIAPDVAMTSAHCIEQRIRGIKRSVLEIAFGPHENRTIARVIRIATPGLPRLIGPYLAMNELTEDEFAYLFENDAALLYLQAPLDNIRPLRFVFELPKYEQDELLRLGNNVIFAGYPQDFMEEYWSRGKVARQITRMETCPISDFDLFRIEVGCAAQTGDSGAPALLTTANGELVVAGVLSYSGTITATTTFLNVNAPPVLDLISDMLSRNVPHSH